MTLRELYNYVLAAVSTRPPGVSVKEHAKTMKRAGIPIVPPNIPQVLEPHIATSFISTLSTEHDTEGKDSHDADGRDSKIDKRAEGGKGDEVKGTSTTQNVTDRKADDKEKKVSFRVTGTGSPPRQDKAAAAAGAGGKPPHVTYRERLGGYLHPRDMRRLVTPFSSTNSQEIMVRRHVILLNCDPLRAIVLRDRLLILVPDDSGESILEMLTARILGGREELENSVFGASPVIESTQSQTQTSGKPNDASAKKSESNVSAATDLTVEETDEEESEDDEWDDLQGQGWLDMPFELKAVDAVLHTVSNMLAEDEELLQEAVYDTIDEVLAQSRAVVGDYSQQVLRTLKIAIKEMSSRVDNFVHAINEALDDLEDLSLMNLSRLITHPERFIQPVSRGVLDEESDEPELILEVYMQQALSMYNQLDLLKGQVVTSEELINMQLDTVRNRLLLIDAIISVIALTVSVAALVGSIYGMNVIIGVEEDPNAFRKIVIGTSVASVVFLIVVLFIFYRALALPNVKFA